jgi:hypothetical protein
MMRRAVVACTLALVASAACAAVGPSQPEPPPPAPGALEPEHRGEFVPRTDEPRAPATESSLVDGGGPG